MKSNSTIYRITNYGAIQNLYSTIITNLILLYNKTAYLKYEIHTQGKDANV